MAGNIPDNAQFDEVRVSTAQSMFPEDDLIGTDVWLIDRIIWLITLISHIIT